MRITILSGVTEISAGGSHSHFLKNNGTVWATGFNTNGQLGDGTTVQRTSPVLVNTLTNIIALSNGANHTLFIKDNGTAWATGLNSNRQLGDGTTTPRNSPVQVSTVTSVIALDAGATHSLFLQSNGLVYSCGRNANGQLGDGTTTARSIPVQVVTSMPCGRVRSDVAQETSNLETDVESLEAYPNPANGELTIDLPQGASNEVIPISLFDSFGKIAMQDQFNPGEATKTFDTNKLPSGRYLLHVMIKGGAGI